MIYAALGLLAGLLLGFFITNEINRRETDVLRLQLAQLQQTRTAPNAFGSDASPDAVVNADAAPRLSRAEIEAAVERADAAPTDVYQQRYLGQMLYLYAAQTDDTETLQDAAKLLARAHRLDDKNYETLVLLGNALFDLGKHGDAEKFIEARRYYTLALQQKTDDINVRTDLGLTYFLAKPSEPERAIEEYRKSLQFNARHEPTLQNLVAAYIAARQLTEAEQTLAQLKAINNTNPALAPLEAQLAQARNAAQLKAN